jgi:molybdate transport system regulatory protein
MSLEPRLQLTVQEDDRVVFGDAEIRLLEAVGRERTLSEGAATLGLSYRAAWGKLRDLESVFGTRLVERTVGGRHGGSSRLTDPAARLVEQYSRFRDAIGDFAVTEFERCFGSCDCSMLVAGSQLRPVDLTDTHASVEAAVVTKLPAEGP